jgi:hypothetical protein
MNSLLKNAAIAGARGQTVDAWMALGSLAGLAGETTRFG